MKTHNLKTWPEFFRAIEDGIKPFEIRDNEGRDFAVSDRLILREFDPCTTCKGTGRISLGPGCDGGDHYVTCPGGKGVYTGRTLTRRVTYVTSFGQKAGKVVMGIK